MPTIDLGKVQADEETTATIIAKLDGGSGKIGTSVIPPIPATTVTNTPSGSISATTVQGAIDELDFEIIRTQKQQFTVNVTDSPFMGSGSSATTTTTTSLTAGTSTVTVANASSFLAGQGINIAGAGVAGINYIGKVSSIAGNVITLLTAISTSIATAAVVKHDDTAAIQAALDSLATTGGSVFLPGGVYHVNGPLQDTSASNSKIIIPKASYDDYNYPFRFTLEGPVAPVPTARMDKGGVALIITDGAAGWIINSSYVGAMSDPSAVFIADCTIHWVHFKNLAFRAPENPLIGICGGQFGSMNVENVTVDVGRQTAAGYFAGNPFAKPTNDTTAFKTPPESNAANVIIRNFSCYGYGNPIYAQEHTDMANVYISKCINAIKVKSAGHGIYVAKIQVEYATNVIKAEGVLVSLNISHLGTENISGVLIDDPSNQIAGTVEYSMQNPAGGAIVNGAAYVKLQNLRNFILDSAVFQTVKTAPYAGPSVTLDKLVSTPEDTTTLLFNYKGVQKGDITYNQTTGQTMWSLIFGGKLSLNIGGYEMFNFSYSNGIIFYADVTIGVVGFSLKVKSGTNALAGTVTLASGIGTITSTAVTTDTIIMLSLVTSSGTPGLSAPLAKVNAGSANITGAVTDNSTYNWIALKKY